MYEAAGADVGRAPLGVTGGPIELALHLVKVDDFSNQSFQLSARRNSPSKLSQTYHSSTVSLPWDQHVYSGDRATARIDKRHLRSAILLTRAHVPILFSSIRRQ